jgi:hypothetical protein
VSNKKCFNKACTYASLIVRSLRATSNIKSCVTFEHSRIHLVTCNICINYYLVCLCPIFKLQNVMYETQTQTHKNPQEFIQESHFYTQLHVYCGKGYLATVQTSPGVYPASYIMGTGSFLGVKRSRCGVDHPPLSSTEVKERVWLYLYSPSGSHGLF